MNMIHYYDNYAQSRDIDCFFRIGNRAFHFASNGQPIPRFITKDINQEIQFRVYRLLQDKRNDIITIWENI